LFRSRAGGISYGYASSGDSYAVHEQQAPVVRRIFTMYARGDGQRSIARTLNDEGIASPRAGKRGTGSWAPSAIHAILTNPRYIGRARYNQTRKLYRGGTKTREGRPLQEHVTYDTPAIIDVDLWAEVEARFQSNEAFSKPNGGRQPRRTYLLTGLARCALCQGPMTVGRRRRGRENVAIYMCSYQHKRGKAVCTNTTCLPISVVNAAVVAAVKELVTREAVCDLMQEIRGVLRERMAQAPAEAEAMGCQAAARDCAPDGCAGDQRRSA
jgi:site-specific DNA recombinase